MEGVLESDRILPVLKRDRIPSQVGPGVDIETQREAKDKEQAGGGLHPGKRLKGTVIKIKLGCQGERTSTVTTWVEYIAASPV